MSRVDDKRIAFGGAIKSIGSGRVGGYLVAFANPSNADLHGQYFSPRTEFRLDEFPLQGKPVLYHHGMDATLGMKRVGTIDTVRVDDVGVWVEAQLEMRDEYERMIAELARDGKLGWSSGAFPQSVRVADDGHIDAWVIIEGSLTPTPAQPHLTMVSVKSLTNDVLQLADYVKANNMEKSMDTKKRLKVIAEELETIAEALVDELNISDPDEVSMVEEIMTDEEAVQEVLDAVEELVQEEQDGEPLASAEADDDEKMQDEEDEEMALRKRVLKAALRRVRLATARVNDKRQAKKRNVKAAIAEALKSAPARGGARDAVGGAIGRSVSVGEERRFATMSAAEMSLATQLIMTRVKAFNPMATLDGTFSEAWVRTLYNKVARYASSDPYADARHNESVKSVLPIKANELNASTLAGQGQEWVGEFWATDLWYRERYETIFDRLVEKGLMVREVPQGAQTIYMPSEGSDPVVYARPQATDLDATNRPQVTTQMSAFGTGRVAITPGELSAALAVTDILSEDSAIDTIREVNRQLVDTMMEVRDRALINGDTATAANTNINLIDGTPATGNSRPYYLVSDGFRKLALVTATTQSRDAGATLGIDDYRLTLALLAGELRQYRNRMAFIIDPDTETASLALDAIATDDVRRTNATITSGLLQNIYGVDVMTSGFVPKSDATGKVSATPANNSKGTILLVYAPYWAVAFKREITFETGRDILSGTTMYVATMRMGIGARGTNAAALSYNVNV